MPTKALLQAQPYCLHPSGAPTNLPLSHPFCLYRTYLLKTFPEATLEAESFMVQIRAASTLRVKLVRYIESGVLTIGTVKSDCCLQYLSMCSVSFY